ncbi:MAG TPA: phosphate acetyltransferase [Caldithrix abyssi]|uniref:Phosphate acetyltransferase n=1 Tax=Caldithrix abyssi TaxID=187145 RepID=A0A7V4WWD6_CALAY|nr:phosphate acetyltransferase [Caldithrix abyssi]
MGFIEKIRSNAAKQVKTIVLPETSDPRVLEAAAILSGEKLVKPILVGNKKTVEQLAREKEISLTNIETVDPLESDRLAAYAEEYYELRKHKGVSREEAAETVKNPLFFAAFMVRNGQADGAVAGSLATTGDVLRAAIQVVGLAAGIKVVSSSFIMVMPDGQELTFGDCAVIPNPDAEQLASIAVSTAFTHQRLVGQTPNVAMLSFSTKGSAKHEDVDKVVEATKLAKKLQPKLNIDGELQFDAAYVKSIGERKAPGSTVAGKANVFIFPDLDAGNIGYKITQRLAGAEAIGPVIQGLAKPYNDLSRGCSVEDIVNVACICSILA